MDKEAARILFTILFIIAASFARGQGKSAWFKWIAWSVHKFLLIFTYS